MTDPQAKIGRLEQRLRHQSIGTIFAIAFAIMALSITIFTVRSTGKRLSDQNSAMAAQGQELKVLAEKIDAQSVTNGAAANAAKDAATAGAAAATTGADAARDAKAAAEASQRSAAFLEACFKPGGECAKAAERSRLFIEGVGREVVTQVGQLRFIVSEIRPGVFEAVPAPAGAPVEPCVPAVQLGNVGVAPGVICREP